MSEFSVATLTRSMWCGRKERSNIARGVKGLENIYSLLSSVTHTKIVIVIIEGNFHLHRTWTALGRLWMEYYNILVLR